MSTYNSFTIVMGLLGIQIVEGYPNHTRAVQVLCLWKDVFRVEIDNQLMDPPVMKCNSVYSDPHEYAKPRSSSSNNPFGDKDSIRPWNELPVNSATVERGICRRLLLIKHNIQSVLQNEKRRLLNFRAKSSRSQPSIYKKDTPTSSCHITMVVCICIAYLLASL